MKTILKYTAAVGVLAFGGLGVAHAETIVSATQISYNFRDQPVCSATRMNPAIFSTLTASDNPCALKTAGSYGDDRITKSVYDNAGQVTQVIQAYGTTVQRTYSTVAYSDNGKITDQIDANGNRTRMVYDGFDRLITYNYPSTTRPTAYNPTTQATALSTAGAFSTTDYEQYDYDASGNKTYTRRRDGQVINDCYDALSRISVHYVHAQSGCTATGGAADVYTAYDAQGRIVYRRFASTSGTGVSYAYDGLGRMNATTAMNGKSIWIGFGRPNAVRTGLVYSDGLAESEFRDAQSRLTSAGFDTLSTIFTQTFDNNGNRTQLSRTGGALATNYTYDALGRLNTFQDDFSGSGNDITWTFSGRNPANQIISWSASTAVYDYKETANATVNQTYDGLNRDAAIAAVSGGYDARGNLTKDASRTFTYDIENRLLTKASTTDGQPNITLAYDPEGRLASYTSGTTTTTFVYDGVDLIAEYNSAGTLLRRYIHGDGVDEPLVWFEGAGTSTRRNFVANYQGSVIAYTDSGGSKQQQYKYGPYGEPKDINNADYWSGASRFGYTGQTILREARLYYYKARVYDPVYGHFMQTDPIGSKDDLDLYAYVADDPVNRSDPNGLEAKDLWDWAAKIRRGREIADEELAKAGNHHNDEGDAIRHSTWMKRMSEETGGIFSGLVGVYHEFTGVVFNGEPLDEARMDLHNNAVGIAAARNKVDIDKKKLIVKPVSETEYSRMDKEKIDEASRQRYAKKDDRQAEIEQTKHRQCQDHGQCRNE